ncbi:hypothetical protein GIS00_05275 [Nakamurella sp. YIM 132087]|uniref:Uncharacterized protein n=1 Tax=Nakamurella alba TaxID=2665158 RepID=A0A7K1FGU9_9ACTN|nr:hypothetical protein [Nakamurella alba]MTD13357.1 hypothetical protein [Nakamurella alba]
MSSPDESRHDQQADRPDAGWGGSADETQVLPPGSYQRPSSAPSGPIADPGAPLFSGPTEQYTPMSGSSGTTNDDPATSYLTKQPDTGAQYGYGAPAYSDVEAAPPPTATYPPTPAVSPSAAPPYAPQGYPQAYVPVVASTPPVAPPAAAASSGSRVLAGFLSALIGLILVGGGLFLTARYGANVYTTLLQGVDTPKIADLILTGLGLVLLFGAVLLNSWSPWATAVPGVALAGLGAWAISTRSGLETVSDWSEKVLTRGELAVWHAAGWTLLLGLLLLGASIATAVARGAGRRAASPAPLT